MKPIALSLLALLAVPAPIRAETKKPNIVFLLADDLEVGNVGCYGADHAQTPNIDALAKGGTRYTHAYTAPLCGPSRALIMTGRYAFRTGATNQDSTCRPSPRSEPRAGAAAFTSQAPCVLNCPPRPTDRRGGHFSCHDSARAVK